MKLSQKSVHFRYSNYCLFPLCIIQINALFFDEKKIWSKFQTFQLFNFMIKTVRFSVTIFFHISRQNSRKTRKIEYSMRNHCSSVSEIHVLLQNGRLSTVCILLLRNLHCQWIFLEDQIL